MKDVITNTRVLQMELSSFLTAIINSERDFMLPNGSRLQHAAANFLDALNASSVPEAPDSSTASGASTQILPYGLNRGDGPEFTQIPIGVRAESTVREEMWEIRYENMIYCVGSGKFVALLGNKETRDQVVEIHNASLLRLEEKEAAGRNTNVLQTKLQALEAEEVRRIKHLNRLGSWAQQDPTGPLRVGNIQDWVLNEIKAALGSKYEPSEWEPEYLKVRNERDALREKLKQLLSEHAPESSDASSKQKESLRTALAAILDAYNEYGYCDCTHEPCVIAAALERAKESLSLHSNENQVSGFRDKGDAI